MPATSMRVSVDACMVNACFEELSLCWKRMSMVLNDMELLDPIRCIMKVNSKT